MDKSDRWKWMHGRNQDSDGLRIRQPLLGVNVLADGLRTRVNALISDQVRAGVIRNMLLGVFLDLSSRPPPVSPFGRERCGGEDDERGDRQRLLLIGINTQHREHGEAGE
jgi:hypothetical protein